MLYRFNKILKITVGVCISAFCFSSCADWTTPESVEIHYPTLEEQNPELYEAYTQSLREYRESEHGVTIVKFENLETFPAGQSEHISALPDSVDYVILQNPDNLNAAIVSEMEKLQTVKGTKTLYNVSYESIKTAYDAYVEKWEEEHTPEPAAEENPEEPVEQPTPFDEFLAAELENLLSLYGKYPYDGINFVYTGVFPESLPEEARTAYFTSQKIYFDKMAAWIEANPTGVVTFEGIPFNVSADIAVWDKCDFIIIDAIAALNADELSYNVRMALTEAVRNNNIIIGVTAKSVTNEKDTKGLWTAMDGSGQQVRAIVGAADWTVSHVEDFNKAGICIGNVRHDYFNILKTYKYTREAISIMNPSPLK